MNLHEPSRIDSRLQSAHCASAADGLGQTACALLLRGADPEDAGLQLCCLEPGL